MPESPRHLEQRVTLYQTLRRWFSDRAHVGSDQFVYWDATDPRQCCAPDVFVRLGPRNQDDCWKAWIRGAPDLAMEILSRSDRADEPWETKIRQYQRLGVSEVVCFDWNNRSTPLRIWDRIEEDLVERDPSDPDFHHCDVLEAFWIVRDNGDGDLELRLSHDPLGTHLFPTSDEEIRDNNQALAQRDQALAQKDQALAQKSQALAQKDQALAQKSQALAQKDQALAQKDQALARKDQALADAVLERRQAIAEKEVVQQRLSELEAELKRFGLR